MDPVCLFCKSFRPDIDRFAVLLESVIRHNVEGIPFVLSVPRHDLSSFRNRFGSDAVEYITDEELIGGWARQTWKQQQRVKMHFWEVERATASVMLDSDFEFLRDFGPSDFIDSDGTPLFVAALHSVRFEDGDPAVWRALRGEAPRPRLTPEMILKFAAGARPPGPLSLRDRLLGLPMSQLKGWFGREGPDLRLMPGPILSYEAQRTFRDEYLIPNGLTYRSLLRVSPWEYVWLGEWLLARRPHPVRPVPPPFLEFVSDAGVRDARAFGITREDIARDHLGVVLAARHQTHTRY